MSERILPSASPLALPAVAEATPQMVSAMNQWAHQIAILQNDVSNAWKTINQVIAQEAAYVHQQWDHFLDTIIPTAPQAGRGSGSGSGTMTTAYNAQNQPLQTATPQAGSGSGSGATITAHENASVQRVLSPAGSGSGSGSGTVTGEVWLDNNGDGSIDEGEQGFTGITVNLVNATTGQVVDTKITDYYGDYTFYSVYPPGDYQIQVELPDGDYATIKGADSQIDADGYSPAFAVVPLAVVNAPKAGIRSTVVTTTDDDAAGALKDKVTLRDAIETVNNGLNEPVTFKAGVSGTIFLQAKLPDLSENITITGPTPTNGHITVQGAGNANNPYRIFEIYFGVTAEIDNLTITGGVVTDLGGGGIYNLGTLTLNNDQIDNNEAINREGGGIFNATDAKLTLNNTEVASNTSGQNGGGIANYGTITGSSSLISDNTTASYGGGIYNGLSGNVTLSNTQISFNKTQEGFGGGVFNAGTFELHGGEIYGNNANGTSPWGGGLYNGGQGVVILDQGVTVENNSAHYGAGLFLAGGSSTTLQAVTVQNNILIGDGVPQGKGIFVQNGALLNYEGLTDTDDPDGQPVYG